MEQKEFYKRFERILQLLNTRRDQYTDSDPDGQTLDVNDDVEVYDKIEQLIRHSEASDNIKKNLELMNRKIKEAYLLGKDTLDWLKVYD